MRKAPRAVHKCMLIMISMPFGGLLATRSEDAHNYFAYMDCSALEAVRKVGEGSFAEVYIAQWNGDEVAIKVKCCIRKQ